ncbi:MAG TPA: hypothetical protein VH042_04290 [Solirubrobacterales bacterium]|jgi:hypothetical protein|nr:hypothetical protein [Solirubrobacterales bacterium]
MLGGFALDVLDAATSSKGWSPEQTVERAIRAYLDDRELRPPGWACLPLPERESNRVGGPTVEVGLPDGSREDIAAEAEAQGVALAEVVAHVLMYFWAAECPPTAAPEESGDGLREDADVKVPAAGQRLARHRTLRGTSGG